MLNLVVLIGRLTHDPELRYTPGNGTAVTTFDLAVDRSFTNKQGEREADFIRIVTWDKLAETCANYLQKGRLVAATGRLQIRSYDDREGVRRKSAEVVAREIRFLDSPRSGDSRGPADSPSSDEVSEDDIPF
ncbi:MAG: single-stranded DNA-binding protein [Firmicutes bacterium]|nr:single-stranded DNA-binding protein [Bacillota bacterium]